jgi:phosphoribosylglycinamide formyltransferase-1
MLIMKKVVIFASGSGTNAKNIIVQAKEQNLGIEFVIFSNNAAAKVHEHAKALHVTSLVFDKEGLINGFVLKELQAFQPDLIVLAGFLLHLPSDIVKAYPDQIINIHPSLLPKYGGKGMYGNKVHQAVLNNNETETGITIHFVNEFYDEGAIIFQRKTSIVDCTSAEIIANKIHQLEMQYFPGIVFDLIKE